MNIDAQDAQDNQDGTLLHQRLTPAMIARGFVDAQDDKPAVSRKNPVHPVHRCEIYPCLTMPVSSHPMPRVVSGKSGPATSDQTAVGMKTG